MMRKIRLILLLFLLGTYVMPVVSYAAECSEETKEKVRAELKEKAKSSAAKLRADAKDYNDAVEDYKQNCDAKISVGNKPTALSKEAISAAEQINEKVSAPEMYQYTSVYWAGDIALAPGQKFEKVQECKDKALSLSQKQRQLNSSIYDADQKLLTTTNNDLSTCKCDENGENADCAVVKEAGEIESQEGTCHVNSFLNALSACPLCPIFKVVLKTGADIAHIAWEGTAASLSIIVGTFFLVLLAFEALKAVASVGGIKPGAFFKSVLVLGLKIAITLTLLSSSVYIYQLFISPVIKGGLDMGLAVAQASGGTNCAAETVESISSQEFDQELFNSVLGTVRCFSTEAATVPAIGMGLLCLSPSFSMFISGLVMTAFGLMIWLSFSFYLIDATVQLGMLSALVPLLIACWPFEMTKQYTAKGVKMLMNSFFTYAFAGVMILMATSYVTAALTGGKATKEELIEAINNASQEAIEPLAALEGTSILVLVSCCFFAIKMISIINGIAGQFSSGSGMSYGAKLGGMATSAATSAGMAAFSRAKKLGGAGVKAIGNHTRAGRAVKSGYNKAKAGLQRGWGKTWSAAGSAVGLGKFQNKNAGTATQSRGTEQEKNRSATPGDNDNENPIQNSNDTADNEMLETPEDDNEGSN